MTDPLYRGILYGVAFSAVLWALIIWALVKVF